MPKLTGLQRAILTKLWIQRGKEGDKEVFIKRVCEAKGITYTPPISINRRKDI
jgi:hypothetical protein